MKVSLHTSAFAATAHEAAFLPWLKRIASTVAQYRQHAAVLVPTRGDAYALKARALAAGIGVFGVHFLTPPDLRNRLGAHLGLNLHVPLREHLHLLLSTAAERIGQRLDPDQGLKAIDLLGAGGWTFAEAGPPALRPLIAEFENLVAQAGFRLMHQADRDLQSRSKAAPAAFSTLFVAGFNGLHWPIWPLLAAAVYSASEATVILTEPRIEAEELDRIWIGTWEETFGAAETLPADEAADASPTVEFLVGRNTTEQARAIVGKAVQFLADPACAQLGILFPSAGALSRRVASLLAEHGIAHDDGLAHQAPGPLEDAAWPAWCELQEDRRIPKLLRFLAAHRDPGALFDGLPLEAISSPLTRAFQELLIDDLEFIADFLEPDRHSRLIAGLRAFPFLPEREKLGTFREQTAVIFRQLGWKERAGELERLALDWQKVPGLVVTRRAWLRWLRETLTSWRAERHPLGNHPYSRVHLLPCGQAEARAWSHLIIAGLNEGQWPPALEDTGLIGEEEITALNRRLRSLNESVTTQGRQGEGHDTVAAGHTLCLGPAQRRALVERQFHNTLGNTSMAIAACAQLFDEAAPERRLNPSEFFTRLHFDHRGRAVSQETMGALRNETTRWLEASSMWPAQPVDAAAVRQTRVAFDARRTAGVEFGEYEFALHAAPPCPIDLAATTWEKVLRQPAQTWMSCLLGVAADETSDETPWNMAIGKWVHAWLRGIANPTAPDTLAPKPEAAALASTVRQRATAFRQRVAETLQKQNRTLPDWWFSTWQQAHITARQLGALVADCAGRTHLATEWKLPRGTTLTLPSGSLRAHGWIDLFLTADDTLRDVWVVDYKTGSRDKLKRSGIAKGDGLQLALYALALRELGAQSTGLSVLTTGLKLDAPQLALADLDALTDLWIGLHRMQERAIFGMRGRWRDEYSFGTDYPIATLEIPSDLLDEKWEFTHPEITRAQAMK